MNENTKTEKSSVVNSVDKKKSQLRGLKPFKPGQSGNPKGRPKGKLNYDTRVDMAIELLAKKYVEEQNQKNKGRKGYVPLTVDDVDIEGDIFAQHLNKARNGDRYFIDSFLDRRFGKAKQPVEHSGSIESSVEMNLRIEEAKKKAKAMQDKWVKT